MKSRDDIDYTGIDLVPELIAHHRATYRGSPHMRFTCADLLSPDVSMSGYDLIINRMTLQHLFLGDVVLVLRKFSESGSRFLLTTTFPNHSQNQELVIDENNPGRFRKLNLQLPPLSLTPPTCFHRDGPPDVSEGYDHFLALYQLPLRQVTNCSTARLHTFQAQPLLRVYSCL